MNKQQAFVLRMSPSGNDKVPEGLQCDQIIIGWAQAPDLLNPDLSWSDFREVVREKYYADEENLRKAGNAAGHMWRFVREMKKGDLVVVPHGGGFYVAQILEETATHDPEKVGDDTAFRRRVVWLNDKKAIPRTIAKSALISRMKTQGTCSYASDLLDAVRDALTVAAQDQTPTFQNDLQNRLIADTLDEIRSGRMESFGFERLIQTVLTGLGARDTRIVARSQDKGADILATFHVAGAFRQTVAVQAKHWQPSPPVGRDVVEQLIRGIEAESADLGMVVTSGTISDEATEIAERYFDEKGIKIELVDGEQFAKLIVEHGISQTEETH